MQNSKHIIITGASSGIGLALANHYLKAGNKVSVCARNLESLKSNFAMNAQLFLFAADVSNENDCRNFINQAIDKNGPIDILVNNAGISMRALFEEVDLAVLKKVMDVNFWGAVYCTKFALESIKKNRGVVCSISSIAGYRGLPGRSAYSSSKFALQGFMESLRTELLNTGVHVMWVSPGFTASNIRNVALDNNGASQGETPLKEDKLMSADTCAEIIIKSIDARKRTVVMTLQGKLTVWINKWFPSLADKLVFNHFKKEVDSPLKN